MPRSCRRSGIAVREAGQTSGGFMAASKTRYSPVKFQVTLDRLELEAWCVAADREGITLTQLIRRAMAHELIRMAKKTVLDGPRSASDGDAATGAP